MSDTTDQRGRPAGDLFDWVRRGNRLLADGDAAAAAELLAHAVDEEPAARALRESLARAQYDAGRYPEAVETFGWLVAHDPSDDYAHFGLGLAARRTGDLARAAENLALASAMRPDLEHYRRALRAVRAARSA